MSGDISDFIVVDDLLRDGIARTEWEKAEKLYQEACVFRKARKYEEALEKIEGARKINQERQVYKDEEETITALHTAETKAEETAKKLAETEAARKKAEEDARIAREQAAQRTTESPARESGFGPGSRAGEKKTLRIKEVDYMFCWCPAGSFEMGAFPDSYYKVHTVNLSQGFWMLESEVTQEMWESVMGTTIQEQTNKKEEYKNLVGVGPDYPMYNVSWEECIEFCKKLSELSQIEIRLPTEAEWEYACRAGSTGEYGGTGNLDDMGWYGHKEKYGDKLGNSGERTHEVKTKQANAWGLYDMHGNVSEWCNDWYDEDYYEKSPTTDPTGPESGSNRVYRGGSWSGSARSCRSAGRSGDDPGNRYYILGFRLAASSAQ